MAQIRKTRGSTRKQELNEQHLYRDARSTPQKVGDFLRDPVHMAAVLIGHAALIFYAPALGDLTLISAGLFTWFGLTRHEDCPIKIPIQEKLPDHNQIGPDGKPKIGEGIFFVGNDLETGKEIWLTNDDCRQHFLILGTTGAGKALSKNAPVHTPTGWRRMGDLKVGDRVSTPDGRSARVDGVFPQGELQLYEFEFEDGRTAEACGEHLWEIHHKHWNGKYKPGVSRVGAAKPRILRTREIIDLMGRNKGKFAIRLPEAVEKPEAPLPLDPYLVGALIGDGCLSGTSYRFASVDDFIVEKVDALLEPVGFGLRSYEYNKAPDYHVVRREGVRGPGPFKSPFKVALEELGLAGLHAHEKFVPQALKEGSVAQRWALVQGLMDTDGTCDSRKTALSFATSSERLAKDFQEVVWSLGGMARITTKEPFYRGSSGERVAGRTSYIVHIRHPQPQNFFSLPRKLALVGDYQYADNLKLNIKTVRATKVEDAVCIHVDHPDHLFITKDYVVTHNTEFLLGFVANAMMWGSGALFVDGKGDVSLFAKVFALCARFGRTDDLLVISFMTGNQDLGAAGGKLISNTLNPFSTGSSDALTQMLVSLMDDVGGDGAMWKGRATAMLTGVIRALVWLRDQNVVDLNVGVIRDTLNLRAIIDLGDKNKNPDMPAHIRKSIRSYLTSLPGFQEDKGYKQAQTTLDQHGYLEMQFTKILGSLADVYGHIFATPYGEVDMHDVVLNRRVLVVMLPALEKAADEIANLGKIVVSSLKGMMGATLGSAIEGSWQEVVENRVTNSPSPFNVILDEVGYYMVDGMDLMAAQARSLGFSMTYAAQDLNGMKRLNEKIVGSVIGNTNTKILGRLEDPESGEMAIKLASKAYKTQVGGFSGQSGEVAMSYRDTLEARIEEVDRIKFLDLKAQKEGEVHVVHKDMVVRAKTFYANPPGSVNVRKLKLRTNHFIKVEKPRRKDLEEADRIPEVLACIVDPDFAVEQEEAAARAKAELSRAAARGDEIAIVAQAHELYLEARPKSSPLEATAAAVAAWLRAARGAGEALTRRPAATSAAAIAAELSDELPPARRIPADPFADGRPARPDRPDPRLADPRDFRGDPRVPDGRLPMEFTDAMAMPGRERELPPRPLQHEDLLAMDDLAFQGGPEDPIDEPPRGGYGAPEDDRFAGFEDPARPRGPVRPARIDRDADHAVHVAGARVEETVTALEENDGILRLLADLDFQPEKVTVDEVESRVQAATGGSYDPHQTRMAEPEQLDAASYGVDRALTAAPPPPPYASEPPPLPDEDFDDPGAPPTEESVFMSELFQDLLDPDEDTK